MEIANRNMDELTLQKEVHHYISEPSKIYKTTSGRRLQIISPGRINVSEGPDFNEIAILLDGYLIIGDAEFHKKSSDWTNHQHSEDFRYKNVILHIVLENDKILEENFETLIISIDELSGFQKLIPNMTHDTEFNSEELQNLALHRLLRKTSDAKKLILEFGLKNALSQMTANYIDRYGRKRNRHKYNAVKLSEVVEQIASSFAWEFVNGLQNSSGNSVQESMLKLVQKSLVGEGAHLRRELIINSILPLALAIADDEDRINLFVWYWSIPALNKYGLLTRKYPDLPQNFLWQQQGMLEYIKHYGARNNIASEILHSYGFAEILTFYKLGRIPLEFEKII